MVENREKYKLLVRINHDVYNEFKMIQRELKKVGYTVTFSQLMEETLKKAIDIYKPLVEKLKQNKELTQAEIFELMSKYFAEISKELKYLYGDRRND
jgi:prefoldin subunit 5